jgi:4'-phosphopantetheinyl transferase
MRHINAHGRNRRRRIIIGVAVQHYKPSKPFSAAAIPAKPRKLSSPVTGVALWYCGLERSPDEIATVAASLSPAELARAARFGTDELRHRWIAGRTALRRLLSEALGVPATEVAIRRGVRGRPELDDTASGLDFNVSHTQGVALIAIARGLPPGSRIGVDIERADRDVGADRLARKFLTARERATLESRAPEARRQLFLRYWTCKEAMSKATGDGLAAPFRRLDIELAEVPRLVDGPPPYVPGRWSLQSVAMPAGILASLAIWRGPE